MSQYPSKYSNGKMVGSAQYIAELICERSAKRNNKDLHYRFWVSPEWEKEYKGQLAAAYKLLKTYEDKAIINALLSTKGIRIYSLRAPHLVSLVIEYQKKLVQTPIPVVQKIDRYLLSKGSNEAKKKNVLDKLKDIDNDKNNVAR